MCNFFSAVITREEILYLLDKDAHENIIGNYNLKDNGDFVRVEYIPKDNDIFNHNEENWQLKIDQDFIPDWFNHKFEEEQMKKLFFEKIVPELFLINKNVKTLKKQRFILNSKIKMLDEGIINILKNSHIKTMTGGIIMHMQGTNSIKTMNGGEIEDMQGTSSIKTMNGGKIEHMQGTSSIETMNGGKIKYMQGDSSIEVMNNGKIEDMQGDSSVETMNDGIIEDMWGDSLIETMNNGKIEHMQGDSSIEVMNDGRIWYMWEDSSIETMNNGGVEYMQKTNQIKKDNRKIKEEK